MKHSPSILCLLVGSAATALTAQQPSLSTLVGPRHAASAECVGVAVEGGLRAFGRAYKASFDRGLLYTPALGDAAPVNQDLRYEARSIVRGEQSLLADGAVAGTAVRTGPRRIERRLADGVVERFDVRPEGVEVSYEFARRPAGRGDLVVRAAIATSLRATEREDGTLAFLLDGVGGVAIGAVTGIDADGETVRGGLRLVDGELELRLPGAFVDAARYPLVLDPLIGTEFLMGVNDDGEADVGYQHATGQYLVAWKRRYSAFDHDIYAQFVSPTAGPAGSPVWVDAASDVCSRPRIGTVPTSGHYAIVYTKSASPFGPNQIVCRTLQSNGTLGALTTLVPGSEEPQHHAVGCEITNADDEILVVYQSSVGIVVREVTLSPAGAVAAGAPLTLFASSRAFTPEISRSGGLLGYWTVVWRGDAPGDSEIFGAVVDRSLAVLAPPVALTNNAVADLHPAVDGDGSTFVLAYQQAESPGSVLHDIRGARLQFTGTALNVVAPDVPIEVTPGQDERRPHTTWLGPKHCVVFEEQIASVNTGIGAWLVDDTCVPCNAKMVFDGLNPTSIRNREHSPRVGGRWQFALNGVDDDGVIAFTEADDQPPFAGSIVCQRLQALGNGVAEVNAGPGCGAGGTAFTGGGSPFVIGSQYFTLYANGLAPGAVPFLSIGYPGPTLACGSCVLTDPVALLFRPNLGGAASYPFPVTCNPAFVGLVLEFQWLSFFTPANVCPLAPGLSASNRVHITLSN